MNDPNDSTLPPYIDGYVGEEPLTKFCDAQQMREAFRQAHAIGAVLAGALVLLAIGVVVLLHATIRP